MTLLEMVQDIMSAMDADEINSINDTVESRQVVTCIKTVYNNLLTYVDIPEHYDLYELQASGDTALPVVMYLPSTVDSLIWLKYNKIRSGETDPVWEEVKYLILEDFLKRQMMLSLSDSTVFQYSVGPIELYARNDRGPLYFTSLNDRTMVFDAYDVAVDATLQASKTQGYGLKVQTFVANDSWVANLDSNMFALFYNEAKSLCFAEIKQVQNAKAEKDARRGWIRSQSKSQNIIQGRPDLYDLPNYGRK